jgi:glycosyltransferase involved in cell wall biosynthesis
MRNINYSIIIPHKNIPELLIRCLNSIPRRDDIQIIVVDDNSDPCIVNFENLIKLQDSCIEIILTKEGKGAGFARNIGLKKAIGKWILFADADDYFVDNIFEYLDRYKNSKYDLIFFGIYRINKKYENESNIDQYYDKLLNNAIYNNKIDEYKYKAYVPWGKLIKYSLIRDNNISFDETIAANDKMFSLKTSYKAQIVHFDEKRIYVYVPNNSTITKNKSLEANYHRFYVYLRMNRFLKNISQRKYTICLFSSFIKLINIKEINYTLKALKLLISKNVPL